MSQDPTIICDGCKVDITTTGNSIGYRLRLIEERTPSHAGSVTDMMFYPELDGTKNFCSKRCLKTWLENDDDVTKVA